MTARRENIGDLLLASAATLLPLLPYGPTYLGLEGRVWADVGAALLLLAALAALGLSGTSGIVRIRKNSWSGGGGLAWIGVAWSGAMVVSTGSLAVGLAAENMLGSSVFTMHLVELPERLWRGMSHTVDPLYPIRPWLAYLEGWLAFVALSLALLAAEDVRRRGRAILYGSAVGLILVSAFAVFQYVMRFQLHPYWVRVNPDLTRANATLEDPNALGAYLLLGLAVVAGMALQVWGRPAIRWLLLATALVAALAVLTTVSRVAWVALPVATVLVFALCPDPGLDRLARWARAATFVVVASIAVYLGLRALLPERVYSMRPDSPAASLVQTIDPRTPWPVVLKHREVWWSAALEMIADRPMSGVGLGRFPRLLERYRPDAPAPENAHNFALQVAAEMGWPGFVAVGTTLIVVFLVAGDRRAVSSGDRWLRIGLLVGLVAFALTHLTGHALLLSSVQTLTATFLVAALTATYRSSDVKEARLRDGMPWIGLVVISIAVVTSIIAAGRHQAAGTALRDDWGYAWGLHHVEETPAGEFRWTASDAVLLLRVPLGADAVELRFAASPVVRAGDRVRVVFVVDGVARRVDVRPEGNWQTARLSLEKLSTTADRLLEVGISVQPGFVPATLGDSDDDRNLGIMLRAPRFLDEDG